MIFAEIQYERHYSEMHSELVDLLKKNFAEIEHGLQGDSWIWVFDGDDKVAIDTFSSMQHQVKCGSPNCRLLKRVIDTLSTEFNVVVHANPEPEAHEDI